MSDTPAVAAPIRTFDGALAYLAAQTNYEQRVDWAYQRLDEHLPAFAAFLDTVGAPHRRLPPTVHVAGTKGKGSTCWMLEEALRAQGLRTGLYTSPHLSHVTERIRLDGEPVPPERFAALLERLRPAVETFRAARRPITFFEIVTAMALLAFADGEPGPGRGPGPVDVAILEVGLGGRLDATNVVDADVAIITAIGWDHTDKLGTTLPAIAREKAGILKPGRIGVVGPMPTAEVAEAIREVAARVAGEPPALRLADAGAFGARPVAGEPLARLRYESAAWPALGLGALQVEGPLPDRPRALDGNLACAIEALRALAALPGERFAPLARLDLAQAFAVACACRLPGRAERLSAHDNETDVRVPVVLDSAHTAESLAATAAYCREHGWRPVVVVGLNRDKLRPDVLQPLAAVATQAVCTEVPGTTRAATAAEVAAAWQACAPAPPGVITLQPDADEALTQAIRAAAALRQPVLVTGSVYLAGALRPRLLA